MSLSRWMPLTPPPPRYGRRNWPDARWKPGEDAAATSILPANPCPWPTTSPRHRRGPRESHLKLAASITRSLQADMQAELRNIERAVATGTREAGRGRKTELRRKAAERPNSRQGSRSSLPAGLPRLWGRYGRRLGRLGRIARLRCSLANAPRYSRATESSSPCRSAPRPGPTNGLYVLGRMQENGFSVSVNRRLGRVMRPRWCRKSDPGHGRHQDVAGHGFTPL